MNLNILNTLKTKGKPQHPPEVERAKQHIKNLIVKKIVDANTLIQAGKLAEQGLKDPVMYQMAMQMAQQNGLVTPEQMSHGKNYKVLGIAITAGKLAEELVNEGM
jgi:hypothetical protein